MRWKCYAETPKYFFRPLTAAEGYATIGTNAKAKNTEGKKKNSFLAVNRRLFSFIGYVVSSVYFNDGSANGRAPFHAGAYNDVFAVLCDF